MPLHEVDEVNYRPWTRLVRGLAKTCQQQDSLSLGESFWGMGTLIGDKSYLFDIRNAGNLQI